MDMRERRQHARIESYLSCQVVTPAQTCAGRLSNLSIGGVGLVAPPGLVREGGTLALRLQLPNQEDLVLSAEVVRVDPEALEASYGLRFVQLSSATENRLLALLKDVASGRGAGTREHPRVQQRMHFILKSGEEHTATLNDLSRGGLAFTCEAGLEAGQEITATLGTTLLPNLMEVAGTVTHALPLGGGLFRVGMSFAPMEASQRQRVESLIDLLLEVSHQPLSGEP